MTSSGAQRETRVEPISARDLWIAHAIVAVTAIAAFGRGVTAPLLRSWDDERFLIANRDVQEISWRSFVSIVTHPHFEAYHPLHLLSYWLDVPLFGPSGPAVHATNLLLWCAALALGLRVFVALGLPLWGAAVGVVLYGVHPAQVEAVVWATGRKEILALAFSCAAILLHLRSTAVFDRFAWLARLAYLCAALSKTTTLPLPALLFVVDVVLRQVPWRRALIAQIPASIAGLALGAGVVTIWQHNEMIRADAGAGSTVMLIAASMTHYLETAFWPSATSPVYPLHRGMGFGLRDLAGPACVVLALMAGLRLRRRWLVFSLLAFLILFAPVSNFIPLYFEVQDRYLSLPLLPLAFGAGALFSEATGLSLATNASKIGVSPGLRGAAQLLALVAVLGLAARAHQYSVAWSSDAALWRHAASVHPRSYYAWMKLGEIRRDAKNLRGAISAYEEAVRAAPDLVLTHTALFQAWLVRDQARYRLPGEHTEQLYIRYGLAMGDAEKLRTLAADLVDEGYREAALLPLGRSLELEPVSDERLMRAVLVQRGHGNTFLADFYYSRIRRAELRAQLDRLHPGGAQRPR